MKKLTYIAAPVAMTALLSACTAPGTLDNLGPSGLAAVKEEVQNVLANEGPGGLAAAVENTLSKPGPARQAMQDAARQAVQQAMQQVSGKELFRRVEYNFDLRLARNEAKEQILTALSKLASDIPEFVEKPGKDSNTVTYVVEDLKGMDPEGYPLEPVNAAIRGFPGISVEASIRMDPKDDIVILKDEVRQFAVVAKHPGEDRPVPVSFSCTVDPTFTLTDANDSLAVQHIFGEGVYTTGGGPTYRPGPLQGKTVNGECEVNPITGPYHYLMMADSMENVRVAQYHRVNVVTGDHDIESDYTEGEPLCPPSSWIDQAAAGDPRDEASKAIEQFAKLLERDDC